MKTVTKFIFLLMWAPGFFVAFPLRIFYQGILIGIKTADDVLDKTD